MQTSRDQAAEAAIKAAVVGLFGDKTIDRIVVIPGVDQAGEQDLSVTVYLKSSQKRVPSSKWLDTLAAAATALRQIEDYRFPYVTFLSPEDESAEDTRPAA